MLTERLWYLDHLTQAQHQHHVPVCSCVCHHSVHHYKRQVLCHPVNQVHQCVQCPRHLTLFQISFRQQYAALPQLQDLALVQKRLSKDWNLEASSRIHANETRTESSAQAGLFNIHLSVPWHLQQMQHLPILFDSSEPSAISLTFKPAPVWPISLLNSWYLVFSLVDAWNKWVMYTWWCNRGNWHSEVVFNSFTILARVNLEFLMDVWFGINREHSCCNLKVVDNLWARCYTSPSLFFMSILAWVRKQFLPVFSILIKPVKQPIGVQEVTPGDSARASALSGSFCWWFLFRFQWQLVFWC